MQVIVTHRDEIGGSAPRQRGTHYLLYYRQNALFITGHSRRLTGSCDRGGVDGRPRSLTPDARSTSNLSLENKRGVKETPFRINPTCKINTPVQRQCSIQMTNLLSVLPNFDIKPFTHILPSLEKALISTSDLLTLDALDVAKRAQVPPGEVKKLANALLDDLYAGIKSTNFLDGTEVDNGKGATKALGDSPVAKKQSRHISMLDDGIDTFLGGGIAPNHLTEFVGER